ncbi:hypothetical protein U0X36_05745 [Bacillus thuringiensis]|uniref:hypothetical protein n=1 Tax=Bacillus thuringiensis TaxID=1428 RepID=UPI000E4F3CDB|nr:hypothetical protein [Bacillus thuringiensis]MDZ3952443.1 hypothetical protein [Bacillus thuringiensis]
MRLKEENTAEAGSQTFEQILTGYLDSYKAYFWESTSNNPNLKDVRRKIIIKNVTSSKSFGIPYSTLSVQDVYKIKMYGKWESVKIHLYSANGLESFGDILKGAPPWFVASGYNSRNTGFFAENSLSHAMPGQYPDYPRDVVWNILYKGTDLMTTEFIPRLGLLLQIFQVKG